MSPKLEGPSLKLIVQLPFTTTCKHMFRKPQPVRCKGVSQSAPWRERTLAPLLTREVPALGSTVATAQRAADPILYMLYVTTFVVGLVAVARPMSEFVQLNPSALGTAATFPFASTAYLSGVFQQASRVKPEQIADVPVSASVPQDGSAEAPVGMAAAHSAARAAMSVALLGMGVAGGDRVLSRRTSVFLEPTRPTLLLHGAMKGAPHYSKWVRRSRYSFRVSENSRKNSLSSLLVDSSLNAEGGTPTAT